MTTTPQSCVGYIQLVFFDDTTGETVTLGGAGFLTKADDDAAWASVPTFNGNSSFMADRLDSNGDIVDDKAVSAETCELLTGKPIQTLIEEGRAALAAELASYAQRDHNVRA